MRTNTAKRKLQEGQATIGTWLATGSSLAAEMLAHQGFDWLNVDMEHNAIDLQTTQSLFQAIATTDTIPFARVPWNDPQIIKRVLDIGAYGVVIPTIEDKAQAEQAVGACRYPPHGYRGMGTIRGRLYGGDDYAERANDEICVVLMLETKTAVDNADDILSVPGIDAVFIGPNDLAASMGLPLGLDNAHPDHVAAVESIRRSCENAGVPSGIHCATAQSVNQRIQEGFQWIALSSDAGLMTTQANAEINSLTWTPSTTSSAIHE